MEKTVDCTEMLEHQPFVVMRLTYGDNDVWNTLYVTDNVEKFGFSKQALLSGEISWNDMLHPDDRVLAVKLAHDYMDKRLDRFRLQYRILTPQGKSIFISEYSTVNRDADGNVQSIDTTLLNTTSVQMDKEIVEKHNRQQAILNDILINLQEADLELALQIILDRTGEYLDCSRALLFQDSPDHKTCKVQYEWLNSDITSVKDLDYAVTYSTEMPEIYVALQKTGMLLVDAGQIPENCKEEFEKEGLVSSAIFAVYLHGSHYGFVCFDDCVIHRTWDEETANFLKNIANLISTVLMRMHTERQIKVHENKIRRMAFTDYLTDLPNRYRSEEYLAEALAAAAATGDSGYLLFTDLDDFKIVNDGYGHDYGDGVLVSFATYLRELFGNSNPVLRFGGDEFVVIVTPTNGKKLQGYLDAMLERARKPWKALDRQFHCSLSIGVVQFPEHGKDPMSLIKKSDIAMYQAKQSGKNAYAFYTEGLDSDALQRTEMEALLRDAMANNCQGFVIHYQPYTDTSSGSIVGAEALVRMRGVDGSLILPEEFLPLAEYLGFMGQLGEFVLSRAAAECRALNTSGYPDFSITVNLSPKQFKAKNFMARLEEILRESGVNIANFIISINENVALGELEKMLALCAELRRKGIRVALDDFGSGSSSFINMRMLPVDIIKVSSRYVDDIDDEFSGAFIKLVTELGHFTGKKICMNGVETEKQYQFCKSHNVDMVQGFLLHKPAVTTVLLPLLDSSVHQN